MSAGIVALFCFITLYLGYRIYGKWIDKNVLNNNTWKGELPSREFQDDIDYVPTKKSILWGHHFSSIAGASPIVGPAVAIIWGWVPALIWILLGVIFMGATHDFGALVISLRHKGKTLGEVIDSLFGKKLKNAFLLCVFFLGLMVISVFALIIAILFIDYPSSVLPVNGQIIFALLIGLFIHRKGKSILAPTIICLIIFFGLIHFGIQYPIHVESLFGEYTIHFWIIFLLIYCMIASSLPVWALLQPRDYLNSFLLFIGLIFLILGLFLLNPKIVAPAFALNSPGSPPWFPFLFVTIACGAISGFHGLVASATTSKQIEKTEDSKIIGYGGMLGEGLLAIIATLAVASGFQTSEAWHSHFSSWSKITGGGLSTQLEGFIIGATRFLSHLGLDDYFSQNFIVVIIICFSATSLDTATRIQRYTIEELTPNLNNKFISKRYIASFLAVIFPFFLIFSKKGGKGGLSLWPLFGTSNQMLAAMTLIVISLYLSLKYKKIYKSFLFPGIFVSVISLSSLYFNFIDFLKTKNFILMGVAIILFTLQITILLMCYRLHQSKQSHA